jgi:superfamily II DNA or RNA helicase
MASLSRALSADFDSAVRQRGARYFRAGRVSIQSGSESHVTATVRGSKLYTVELRREDQAVQVSCTCPHFEVDLCKHVWAVLLAAEERRLLGDVRRGETVYLDYGSFDDEWDDEDEDEGGEDEGSEDDLDDEEDEFGDSWDDDEFARPRRSSVSPPSLPHPPQTSRRTRAGDWRKQLASLPSIASAERLPQVGTEWPAGREILYVIDLDTCRRGHAVYIDILVHDLRKDGTRGKPKSPALSRGMLNWLPDADDRRILASLAGADQMHASYQYGYFDNPFHAGLPARYRLIDPQPELLLPVICATGRCRVRLSADDDYAHWLPVGWEDAEPWRFALEVRRAERANRYDVTGVLRRGAERMDLAAPLLLSSAGVMVTHEHAARYTHGGAFEWIALLREQHSITVPTAQSNAFLTALLSRPALPPIELPEELRYEEVACRPRPRLRVEAPARNAWNDRLRGELSFDYEGEVVVHGKPGHGVLLPEPRRMLLRDAGAENEAQERLAELGWKPPSRYEPSRAGTGTGTFELPPRHLPRTVRELVAAGWHVEAEGKLYRAAGRFDLSVTSGMDWFELRGGVDFDGAVAPLPELLAAVRRGEKTVRLGDGSFGVLPEEWLQKYGLLAGAGIEHEDHLRFTPSQVGLLDALLAAQPDIPCDAVFARARKELQRFAGVRPAEPPAGFKGELRPYQKEGLGWLEFLRGFGFGGCLADDMGLGKTVQVLALLEKRRSARARQHGKEQAGRIGPSLVVVPKSLIFNWMQEAARFAPRLRVLDHTGPLRRKGSERSESLEHFEDYDLILTTYGTLRNDAAAFKDVRFDYVILDEAQAIKNASSVSAKAVRLLHADHRLALSGTPIENHLGELWSLFEFLNPGMLGAASVFQAAQNARGGGAQGVHGAAEADQGTRRLLARALRPFLLRRTKEQVVQDLPPKIEQTLFCELDGKQRKLYDELRDHYRTRLLKRIESDGIKRAKIQILEALLRLRQAAIHPGLIDAGRGREPSAKLDVLLSRLLEALDEGHKTLVFSQFTSMLGILRDRLDRLGVAYEYLDGRTKQREARVARFQNDADCRLFLISLKAGGVGLNLTAAQYVFLLDPWWNPAVEAQAIDRAHRIGQTNRVFAYRLIARDTIEEKVLELQSVKRELADAILGADGALIRRLSKEDLEMLLG